VDGVWLIEWLQTFSNSTLDSIVVFISELANEKFYMIFLPLLYWCINQSVGLQVISVFLVSVWINVFTKDALLLPRPFWVEEGVRQLHKETNLGYGFPSGHVMGATTIWGYFIFRHKKLLLSIIGVFIIVLIALSRLYLGVHYLTDVIGGLVMALIILGVFFLFDDKVQKLISGKKGIKMLLSTLPLLLLTIYRTPDSFKLVGTLIGLLFGYTLLGERYRYTVNVPLVWQIIKIVTGFSLLILLQTVTALFLINGLGQIVRYAVIGFFATGVIPYLFSILIPCLRSQRLLLNETGQKEI
jgi:sphingosine-1-phosphate phosphatase 2